MVDPFSFSQSRAVRGYSPQFLDTAPDAASATPGASTDLTNRLLQIMSGQLGGTLSGGERLSALGALLKSVSRGSQTSPQQVMQSLQQQKLQQVQGAMQIQELRKAAAEKAQYEQLRANLIAQATDPQEKAYLAIASPKALDQIAAQRFDRGGEDQTLKSLMTLGKLRATNPNLAKAYEAARFAPIMQGSLETGIYSVPRSIPAYTIDPDLLAEMQRRGL